MTVIHGEWTNRFPAMEELKKAALLLDLDAELTGPDLAIDKDALVAPKEKLTKPETFDSWSQRGNRGWGYADVLPYFRRCEQRIGRIGNIDGRG